MFKRRKMMLMSVLLLTVNLLAVSGCKNDDENNDSSTTPIRNFGIFRVMEDHRTIEMDGTINSRSFNNFNKLVAKYPEVTTIEIINCDGSADDETNLKLSREVHAMQLDIHLRKDGLIASGGVDFFLAGSKRTKG